MTDNQTVCTNKNDFCYPILNNSFDCVSQTVKLEITNYLVFDQTNYSTKGFLDFTQSDVLMGIQDFIRNSVIPAYLNNDYVYIPKGPLAIFMQPISMPGTLNRVKNKFNSLLSLNRTSSQQADQLNSLISSLVRSIVADELNNDLLLNISNLNYTLSKLNIFDGKNFTDLDSYSISLWNKYALNVTNDALNVNKSLDLLEANLAKLDSIEDFSRNLIGINSGSYLNFTNISYSVIRLEILIGIYLDFNNRLIIRPTPGLFLISNINESDLSFLPGVFNPISGIMGIFSPGIMSLPIDNFNLNTLKHQSSKYLNKFAQIILPFNLNVILTPYKSFLFDALNISTITATSKLLLTPLDFLFNSSFDFIRKDVYFMSNLFSSESFARLAQSEPTIDRLGLLSTQLFISDQEGMSNKRKANRINQVKGVQFYTPLKPNDNVTILPLISYEDDEKIPIPASLIKTAISAYCSSYKKEMNEFHLRICDAQQKEITLEKLFAQTECKNCSLLDFFTDYYSNQSEARIKQNHLNLIPILVLAAVLSKVYFLVENIRIRTKLI